MGNAVGFDSRGCIGVELGILEVAEQAGAGDEKDVNKVMWISSRTPAFAVLLRRRDGDRLLAASIAATAGPTPAFELS